jgi:hypothetical protein
MKKETRDWLKKEGMIKDPTAQRQSELADDETPDQSQTTPPVPPNPMTPSRENRKMGKQPQRWTDNEKIWATARKLIAFTTRDIAEITGLPVKRCAGFISRLKGAGYFRRDGARMYERRYPIYRLAKDTGPKTPRTVTRIWDPNTNEYMDPIAKQPAQPAKPASGRRKKEA